MRCSISFDSVIDLICNDLVLFDLVDDAVE